MQKKHLDNKSIHIVDVVNICEELTAYVREETLTEVIDSLKTAQLTSPDPELFDTLQEEIDLLTSQLCKD